MTSIDLSIPPNHLFILLLYKIFSYLFIVRFDKASLVLKFIYLYYVNKILL